MDLSEQMDLILLDFSKAFDKVPHERLLYKAQYYGIDGSTLLWIRDFLSSIACLMAYGFSYAVRNHQHIA
jgi:hypothetical protein